jgi:hypothetical protein
MSVGKEAKTMHVESSNQNDTCGDVSAFIDKGNCSEENDEQNGDAKCLVQQIPFV